MGPAPCRSGFSLVELLVAVVMLELAAMAVVAALVTTHRLDRATRSRAATDLARRDTAAARAAAADCRAAPSAEARPLALAAAPGRPALQVTIRCGR